MPDYIDEVFGPEGTLSKAFAGYEPRGGQIALARLIDKTIIDKRHLLSEAACGSGKSFAYCVPSIWHTQNGLKVAIATANIALQEQLFTKDLPTLQKLLPWKFTYALIKGRSNFLCVSKWQNEQISSSLKTRKSKKDREQYRSILSWARKTSTGDVSELDFTPQPAIWHLFSSTSDECKGKDCKFYSDCLAEKAKEKASEADIFVTNYHLLFAHLQVRMASGKDIILPPFDIAICDEAHKMADIARDFFGFRVTEGSVRFASRLLGRLQMNDEYDQIDDLARTFFANLKRLHKSKEYKVRFRSPPEIDHVSLCDALSHIRNKFLSAGFALDSEHRDEKSSLMKAASAAGKLVSNIRDAMTVADQDMVYFLETNLNESIALVGKPIDVAPLLSEELFSKTHSVIATSATLAVDGGFSHIAREIGALSPLTLIVGSPFDFEKQTILVIPENMPEASDKSFPDAVAEAVYQVIGFADGRTLCLFTSYKNLEAAWLHVMNVGGFRILKQGDRPRTTLIEEFRKDIGSVLMGTESFWTGVDVPGEALSCVVIDRLPFQTPDDPILDAISERDKDWFMSYSVPKAIIAFKQGFGRLLRRATDRGVVVVLDRRIVTKPYGKKFLASIPEVRKSKKLESIKKFLDNK